MAIERVLRNILLALFLISLAAPLSAKAAPNAGKVTSKHPGTFTDQSTGMEFVFVKGGCFQMGETEDRGGGKDETPMHKVCVDSFYIGKYVVTQDQYEKTMDWNPSNFKACGTNCPVEGESWNDAQEFIDRLNAKSTRKFRLPTEAEWEYAARSGGKNEQFSGGKKADSFAWYKTENTNDSFQAIGTPASHDSTHPVGQKQPNGLGLYDMSGNVWEWVSDWYDANYYKSSPVKNPKGPAAGSARVIRGGSWANEEWYCRTTARGSRDPRFGTNQIGFRLAVTAK